MRTVLTYDQFILREAARIQADGCTGVSEWNHECCLEHDLACRYGRDPRSAYLNYRADETSNPWLYAKRMSRRRADFAFLHCNRCASERKHDGPREFLAKLRSWGRFLGVRIGALLGIGVREASHDRTES